MTLPKRATPTDRVLADFVGRWRLQKFVRQANGEQASFSGTAVWEEVESGLSYLETGTLILTGSTPLKAERRYLWRAPLAVHFQDGRFFHNVPPQGGQARHDCAPDTYNVTYDFSDWPYWSAEWHVSGPRKAYLMRATYTPFEC